MPDRQPDLARTVVIGDPRDRTHLLHAQPADRDCDANVEKARLPLRMHTEMSVLMNCRARFAFSKRKPNQRKGQPRLRFFQEFLDTPAVDKVFQSRFLTVCAVVMIAEHPDHGRGYRNRLARRQQDSAIARKLPMTSDPAELYPKVDGFRNAASFCNTRCDKCDVVRVRDNADSAPAVESHVELARQSVQIA